MISLSLCDESSLFFVLEREANEEDRNFLNAIGLFPESLITVLRNSKNSKNPVIVEIHDSQFMIGRELAKTIFVLPALENQEILFGGNKTQQRETILQVIQAFPTHFSLRECVQKVQEKDEKIGEITVYRALKALLEKNILEELHFPDGARKFELKKGHHDHIFCQNCHGVSEFYNEPLEKLQHEIAEKSGGKLLSHTTYLVVSHCSQCRKG